MWLESLNIPFSSFLIEGIHHYEYDFIVYSAYITFLCLLFTRSFNSIPVFLYCYQPSETDDLKSIRDRLLELTEILYIHHHCKHENILYYYGCTQLPSDYGLVGFVTERYAYSLSQFFDEDEY